MATLISLTGTTSFDSAGKHRLAGRLGPMLSGNSLWHTVRAGPSKPPHRVRKPSGDYHPGADAIQVMTMNVSKDLEFPVVALPGVGHRPALGEDEKETARVFLCGGYAGYAKSLDYLIRDIAIQCTANWRII